MAEESRSQREEAERYLLEIIEELQRREKRLHELDCEIRALEFKLKHISGRKGLLSGDAFQLAAADSFKQSLRGKLRSKMMERDSAQEEVKKARDRRKLVEEELLS